MPAGLVISDFYFDNRVDLRALVSWDPANPGSSAAAEMTGDYAPGVSWFDRNGGVAFLNVIRDGVNLRFEAWGTDTNGDYTAAAIDIFTLPIDLTAPFPQNANLQASSLHIPGWTYVLSPVAGNPNAFRLTAGRSAANPNGVLTISNFYLENGVRLSAQVSWDPANPGSSAAAEMAGDYAPGVSWTDHNGGVAFLDVIRDGANLRFETWGTDTNGDYTAAAIDIFTLPIDLTSPFPQNAVLQTPSLHIPTWTYVLSPVAGNPNAFSLTAGNNPPPIPPSNAQVQVG